MTTSNTLRDSVRTAASAFMAQLDSDLSYVLVKRQTGEEVTTREVIDALADGAGKSATEIGNDFGVLQHPLWPHLKFIAEGVGVKLKGRGRGPSQDPVKAKLGKLANLAAIRVQCVQKVKEPTDPQS